MKTYGYLSFVSTFVIGACLLVYCVLVALGIFGVLLEGWEGILFLVVSGLIIVFFYTLLKTHSIIKLSDHQLSIHHIIPKMGDEQSVWLYEVKSATVKKLDDDSWNPFNFKKRKIAYFLVLEFENGKEEKILLRSLIVPERLFLIWALRKHFTVTVNKRMLLFFK